MVVVFPEYGIWKAALPAVALPKIWNSAILKKHSIENSCCEPPLDARLLKMCVLSVVSLFLSSVWYWIWLSKKDAIFLLKCLCQYSLFFVLTRNSIRDFHFIEACTYYYSNFTSQELRFHEVLDRVYGVKVAPNTHCFSSRASPSPNHETCFLAKVILSSWVKLSFVEARDSSN